ncbi:MAG: HK97 family phage prohead protease [Ruminococcus sp.]|nr:HK97 family phage prohead protease [Ruminococcus sp.]MBQ8119227.1 HK97 family phage prohead protease [Ruminococcus sp.]
MNAVIRRAFSASFETREEGDKGIIQGRPVILNSRTNMGKWDEVIDAGALDETDLTDVRLCLDHDTSYVYARSRRNNGNSTMQISKDAQGMSFSASLNIASSPKAQDYFSAVKRGDMDTMSFMFTEDGVYWEDLESDHPTRHIAKIGTIFEFSCVTFPSYKETSIQARDSSALESIERELESLRSQRAATLDSDKLLRLARAKYEYTRKFKI